MATAVFSREVRNDDGDDLAVISAEPASDGDAGSVVLEMPELGASLTAGEAERLGQALLDAAAELRRRGHA